MAQFRRLIYFEWKKIWKRRSTWITLGLLLSFYLVVQGAYIFGSTYVEGEFLETHWEGRKTDLENARKYSGRKLDSSLLKELMEADNILKGLINGQKEDSEKYRLTKEYKEKVRPYEAIFDVAGALTGQYSKKKNFTGLTEEKLYKKRAALISSALDTYRLSDTEKEYWEGKEKKLDKPFTFQYALAYEYLCDMSGVYRAFLFVSFAIAICMSAVFTEEHGRRMDQLILCSKLGRRQIYFAKIAAGSLFSLLSSWIVLAFGVITAFLIYGADGFSGAVQMFVPYYTIDITMGQVLLVMSGISLLASVLTGIFTMVVSEITRSSIASMSIVTASLFIARLLPVPFTYRMLSQAWNYMPINLLKFDAGFFDMRLVQVFGMKLTSWQFAPVLYFVLMIALVLGGKAVYCRYQVQGR